MPWYDVALQYSAYADVRVEADSDEEALAIAHQTTLDNIRSSPEDFLRTLLLEEWGTSVTLLKGDTNEKTWWPTRPLRCPP